MKGFDPAFMAELKAKNDIVEVISSYVPLNKKGANHWACCPFHHEKTPSFAVNGAEGFYHCFGCGKSGDVVTFIREIESVEYLDAIKILADRAKMSVPDASFNEEEIVKRRKQRETALQILLETAKFYRNNLFGDKAGIFVDYLTKRKILPSTIRKFGFGASLDFRSLPNFLRDKGFHEEDILRSGVCAKGKNGALYDFQAERLIIPIINSMDEVVAFGGRDLKNSGFAKYKNTSETFLFNKRKTLYNINLLKKLKRVQPIQNVIVVEGYMDAITVYQAGFQNVVACMGTSLTPDQARLIKRYTDNILVSFDGDSAGQSADMRGIEIFRREQLNVKVVPIEGGKDPDEVIKSHGAEKYAECLKNAMPIVDYRLYSLRKRFDREKPEEKRQYVAEALKVIRGEKEATVQEELLRSLSKETSLSFEALSRDFAGTKEEATEEVPPPEEKGEEEWTKEIPKNVLKASRFILAAKLFSADYSKHYKIKKELFLNDSQKIIAGYLEEAQEKGETVTASNVFELLDGEDSELSKILSLFTEDGISSAGAEKYFSDCVTIFERYIRDNVLKELLKEFSEAQSEEQKKAIGEQMTALTVALKK